MHGFLKSLSCLSFFETLYHETENLFLPCPGDLSYLHLSRSIVSQTKWEKFAAEKNIQKRKKSRMVPKKYSLFYAKVVGHSCCVLFVVCWVLGFGCLGCAGCVG